MKGSANAPPAYCPLSLRSKWQTHLLRMSFSWLASRNTNKKKQIAQVVDEPEGESNYAGLFAPRANFKWATTSTNTYPKQIKTQTEIETSLYIKPILTPK
jgi:hypothetical protein